MIRTIRLQRLGASVLCPDPYGTLSYINPACWAVWGQDNSPAQVSADCQQAAGGSISSANYQQCVQTAAASATALAASDPAGAQDLSDAVTGDVTDLANPFTGSGVLNPASTGVPVWVWLAGAAGLALVFKK